MVGATDCIIGNVFAIERRKYKPFPIKYHFFNNCWLLVGSNLKVRFGFEDPISRKSLSSWARRSTISAWALKLLIPDGNQTFVKFNWVACNAIFHYCTHYLWLTAPARLSSLSFPALVVSSTPGRRELFLNFSCGLPSPDRSKWSCCKPSKIELPEISKQTPCTS